VLRLGAGPALAANLFTATPTGYAPDSELVIKFGWASMVRKDKAVPH
jgi:hypothetical protein